MNAKQIHTPTQTDTLRIVFLSAAIAASALTFSMNVTNFFHVKETTLAILLVPLAIVSIWSGRQTVEGLRRFLPLVILTALPFIYTIVFDYSTAVAIVHREQARLAVLILFAILALDAFRDERARRLVTNAFLTTATVAAVLALVQRGGLALWLFPEFEDAVDPLYSVFGNSGLLAGYLAMAMPIAIHRALTSPRSALPLLVIVTVAPVLTIAGSRAAWIGAAAGTLLILPYRELPGRRAIMTTLVLIASVGATFIQFEEAGFGIWVEPEKKDTVRLRLWFWDGAIRMAAANPVTGVGLGNFQYWSPKFQGDALQSELGERHLQNEAHTQYAHNEPLHLAAETGIIGFLLCGWMLVRLVRCRGPEWGGLAAAMTFGLFHFPLHSAPHALMILLFAAMLFGRSESPSSGAEKVRVRGQLSNGINRTHIGNTSIAVTAASISFALAAFITYDVLLPSIVLREANTLYEQGRPSDRAYKNAIDEGCYHAQAHASYANALLEQGELEQARTQLEQALKGQDTGDLHLALGYILLQQGNTSLAIEHLQAAIHRWPKNETAHEYLQRASSIAQE